MITTLHIKNIGIIEDLTIDLNKGLNVLTGETGAGKTLIIDSLEIISGGRFSKEMIRKGEEFSFVELCMYSPNNKSSDDGNIIVSREIYLNGRNQCKINGRLVTVSELKLFMSEFIEIHGQNNNQKLLDYKKHLEYVDNFIGEKLLLLKQEYKAHFDEFKKIEKELQENYGDDKEKQRKLDLLKYQFNEIEQARLEKDEEEKLEERRKIILNSEKLTDNLQEASYVIEEAGIDSLSTAIRALEKIEMLDKRYEDVNTNLKSVYYELQEISRDIACYKDDIFFDEKEREEIESRLDLIYSLKRKYGNNLEEIINYKDKIEQEIIYIENIEEHNNKLKKDLQEEENILNKIALDISNIRQKYSYNLSDKINKVLKDLEMKNASINVKVTYKENEFFETGKDEVRFYITTNIGEDEKELDKIASGGEMSRIMLAIKKVLADTDKTPILIFDEIDTGISGRAANSVAEKLKEISFTHQVLCISHLASIAAKADYNYHISKQVNKERTNTNVKLLNEEEVIEEIARISSGDINEATIKYAYELRNKKVS